MSKVINTILNLKDNMSGGLLKAARNTEGVTKEMQRATRTVVAYKNKASDAIDTVVKRTGALAVAGAGAFAAFSFKTGMEFEAQMSKVAAISGATETEMELLTAKAKEMGRTTQFSATESAQALEYMGMAGWNAQQMTAGLPGIMSLAAASGEELGTVSDIVTDALTAFGLKASDAAHFSDVLAQASSKSNTNVSLMGETFQYAAPVAGALGYSIEDTAVAIGLMANAGIKGSDAGTALRGVLTNLSKPSDQVAKYMGALGVSLTDAQGKIKPLSELMTDLRGRFAGLTEAEKTEYAAGIAGKNAMSGLLAIVGASDEDFNNLTAAIADSSGAAEKMAATANDNLRGDLMLLKSAAEDVGDTFYSALKDKARGGVQALTDKISEWAADGTIDAIAARVADGVTVLVDKGQLAVSWLMDNKETVIGAIKGIAGAFVLFKGVKLAGDTIDAARNIGLFGQTVFKVGENALPKLGAGIKGAIGSIGTLANTAFSFVAANPIVLFVAAAVAAGILLWKNWDTVEEKATVLWSKITETFTGIKDGIVGAFDAAKEKVSGFFSWMDEKISSIPVVGGVYNGVKGAVGWVGEKLGIGANAMGTSYWRGGLTRVHERGGEILNLPGGTQIIPHDLSRRAVGRRAVTVNVTVQGNMIGNERYADEMGEHIVRKILDALDHL